MQRTWMFAIVMLGATIIPCAAADRGTEFGYEQVEFSVRAEAELPNDLAEIVLAVQTEHSDPARVAKDINDTMTWALSQVHAVADIEANNGGYQTYPVYDKNRLHHWRGLETLVLRSKRIEALNTLVGTLQQRLQVQSMRFIVSPNQQQIREALLIDQALDQFKDRALRIQQRLGAKGYEIMSLKVGGSDNPLPRPMERMSVARVEGGTPLAGDAGTSRQTLRVHAVIQLRF